MEKRGVMRNKLLNRVATLTLIMLGLVGINSLQGATSPSNNNKTSDKYQFVRREALNASSYVGTSLTDVDPDIAMKLLKSSKTSVCQSYNFLVKNDGSNNYILGYYGEGENFRPLTFEYNVVLSNGNTEFRTTQMSHVATNALYDSVGIDIAGDDSFKNDADLLLNSGETVDVTSIRVINIYSAIKNTDNVFVPDYSIPYYIKPKKSFTSEYNQSSFFNLSLDSKATFSGHTSLICSITNVAADVYKSMYRNYSDHEEAIANNTEYVRYRFTSITNSYYKIFFNDKTSVSIAITGSSIIKIPLGKSSLNFLLADTDIVASGINAANIVGFDLLGATFTIDILSTKTNKVVTGSAQSIRFGDVNFVPATSIAYHRINLVVALSALGFSLAFALSTLGIYLYQKNKYKNDEFRRVKIKPFLATAGMAFLTLGLILINSIMIGERATNLNNTLKVFNPLDAYIILFSVLLILLIGYFIKFFINVVKDNLAKSRIEKLGLSSSKEDDGMVK